MTLKIKRFDASKHFETPEAQARLVDDALQSGDAGYIAHALGIVARARGMSALAKETGLSRQALYAALSAEGNPSLDTMVKVTRALGIDLRAGTSSEGAAEEAVRIVETDVPESKHEAREILRLQDA